MFWYSVRVQHWWVIPAPCFVVSRPIPIKIGRGRGRRQIRLGLWLHERRSVRSGDRVGWPISRSGEGRLKLEMLSFQRISTCEKINRETNNFSRYACNLGLMETSLHWHNERSPCTWGCSNGVSLLQRNCECGAGEQTADHIILTCPKHRAPRRIMGLTVLDDKTRSWLDSVTASIWSGQHSRLGW